MNTEGLIYPAPAGHWVTASNGEVFEASVDTYAGGLLTIRTEKAKGYKSAHKLMARSYGRYTLVTRWSHKADGVKTAVSVWAA